MAEFEYHDFIGPKSKRNLHIDPLNENKILDGDNYFAVENGVIDFYNRYEYTDTTGTAEVELAISTDMMIRLQNCENRMIRPLNLRRIQVEIFMVP